MSGDVDQAGSSEVQVLRERLDAAVAHERAMWRQRVAMDAAKQQAWQAYDAGRGSRQQVEDAVVGAQRVSGWEAAATDARGQAWADLVAVLPLGDRETEYARWRARLDAPLDAPDLQQGQG